MAMPSRFDSPSSSLALKSLLRRTQRVLWIGLGLAAAAHLSLAQISALEAEQKVVKPLTTQFVKRQPRLTKPLELKKRPQPRRRAVRRKMVAVKARMQHEGAASETVASEVIGSLAKPSGPMGRAVLFGSPGGEPCAFAQAIGGTREPADRIAMSLELLDVEALDTGRYQAMVIQDPNDKQNLKGYLRLAVAYPHSVQLLSWQQDLDALGELLTAVRGLVRKLNEWTDIKASVSKRITFDSVELFQTPWVYLWVTRSLEPTRGEAANLGNYLLNGGFFFFEGHQWRGAQGEWYLMQFVKSALASQGYQQGVVWEYQLLPSSHPMFHCYYDLPDGPPPGHVAWSKHFHHTGRDDDDVRPRCKGIEIDGRLVAINTNQGYLVGWYGSYPDCPPGQPAEFRFGINTIIFALTQEGSITHRLMESTQ